MRPMLPGMANLTPRLKRIEQSGVFSNSGPQLLELERRMGDRLGVSADRIVILANATLALTGLTQLLKLETWRVPSWTFTATSLAVLAAGKTAVFVDVNLDTHRQITTPMTASNSLVTLPFGVGVPESWTSVDDFPPLIDAAASLGSINTLAGLPHHSNVVFSLHATKYLGAGEGGLVVAGTEEIAQELRSWSNFGFQGSRESGIQGTNAKMSELQAAVVHCALDTEAAERETWEELRKLSSAQDERLGIGIPSLAQRSIAPYWIVRFDSEELRNIAEATLSRASIESRRWWSAGCHQMPAFNGVSVEGDLANTNQLAAETLGLPYFRGMKEAHFEEIGNAIISAIA